MFCNSFIAVFYCFEQWLEGMTISPNWRGVLLASMFAMVLLFRPLASVLLLRRGKLAAMAVSIVISAVSSWAIQLLAAHTLSARYGRGHRAEHFPGRVFNQWRTASLQSYSRPP